MPEFNTLTGDMETLRKEGYTEDFNLAENCLICRSGQFRIAEDEFMIDKVFRYEGDSDPGDETALYAISSPKHGLKGVLVNGYGVTSDGRTDAILAKLQMR
jgi:hypothetical protein